MKIKACLTNKNDLYSYPKFQYLTKENYKKWFNCK